MTSASADLVCVDAFTNEPFRGNPAAICVLDEPVELPEQWMQALAGELNLSETAFVVPRDDGWSLRWFTPTSEVQLCGHATLASAHVLWETARAKGPVSFHTRWKGALGASRQDDGVITMELPSARSVEVDAPAGLQEALGAPLVRVARNDLHHIAEVEDATSVRSLGPDIAALRAVDVEAVAVTAASDDERYDFVSRYFAPKHGVDEDPVTGSAHTSLGPYWSERLGKRELVGYQASTRGGVVRVALGDDPTRVALTGDAVTVWRGTVELPA